MIKLCSSVANIKLTRGGRIAYLAGLALIKEEEGGGGSQSP